MSHAPAATLGVKTIDHVTIVVADLEASRQFYVDLLGMEEVARPAFNFPGGWFQAGSAQIHTILSNADSGPAGWEAHAPQASRGHHFAFEVADGLEAARLLEERGVKIVAGPKHRPDGAVQVYVHDPDGHLVEICSPPAG